MRLVAGFATSLALMIGGARGQVNTKVTCSAASQWAFNSMGQSPCLVAAYLGSVCTAGQWSLPGLGTSTSYAGPTSAEASVCMCSAAFYNEVQACSYCQGGNIRDWNSYSANCPAAYLDPTGFPDPIPAGTVVPTWAFIDPRPLGSFSVAQAQAYELSTSASITPGLTTSVSSTTTTTTTTAAATSTTVAVTTKSSSSVGAIVGGVVGGLGILTAIAAIAFWYFLRKKHASNERHNSIEGQGAAPGWSAPATDSIRPTSTDKVEPSTTPMAEQNLGYRPYNPSDPSTFPSSSPTYGHNDNVRAGMGYSTSPPPIYNRPNVGGYTYHAEA